MHKILLDTPSDAPELGFKEIASALAAIIGESDPRFAIGIFGGWGSGKTTLMRTIERKLDPDMVPVWFNAWRYEREEHLILPLLDILRDALDSWAEKADPLGDAAKISTVKKTARMVARVLRALATGVSVNFGVPGVATSLDVKKALDALHEGATEEADTDEPRSFYHASFKALSETFNEFTSMGLRVVILIDDLDRCLPLNALEVLESMKLFFDLEGFVFVVGLDQDVVESAIEAKYGGRTAAEGGATEASIKGRDYIKKIFQVPYTVPPVSAEQLDEFLMTLEAHLPADQVKDLRKRVRPHLNFVTLEGRINPREIKRYVNAYTVQTNIRPFLNPDVVLAFQTFEFHDEWGEVYDLILAEQEVFTDAVKRQIEGEADAVRDLWPDVATLPETLIDYLGSEAGRPFLDEPILTPYINSIEATRSTRSQLIHLYPLVGRLRGSLRDLDDATADPKIVVEKFTAGLSEVRAIAPEVLSGLPNSEVFLSGIDALQDITKEFHAELADATASSGAVERIPTWRIQAEQSLRQLFGLLRQMRQVSGVGTRSGS
jgi:hypothetical protein